MSDPLSSHEIEDVLSSIRRLVSEDLRPGAVRSRIPVEGDEQRSEARLILTPALRVIQKASAEAAARPAGDGADETDWDFEALVPEEPVVVKPATTPMTEDLRNDRLRAAATMAFPRASAPRPGVFHSRHGQEGGAEDEEEDLIKADPAPTEVMIWDDDAFDEAALQARRHDLLMDTDEEAEALMARHAAGPVELVEAPLPLTGAIIEPETSAPMWSDMGDTEGAWSEGPPAWDEPAAEPLRLVRTDLRENPLARAWADRLEETLRAEMDAEFQDPLDAEVVAEQEPTAEPEAADPVAAEPDRKAERDSTRPEIEAEVAQELGQIDEDLLRELVREVLREELAGDLGERITRNVRKLVRMEINRALASGDFQ